MADPERLELPTSAFEAHCSIQLSYGSAHKILAGLLTGAGDTAVFYNARVKSWDVIVVGAGIIGLSLAIELRKSGARVLVVERREPGREASHAAAGMLADCGDETPAVLRPLATASARMYPEFVHELQDESGINCDLREQGTLLLSACDEDSHSSESAAVHDLEPAIGDANRSAIFLKERSVDPRALVAAALKAAKHRGVDIVSGSPVTGVRKTDEGRLEVTTEKTRYAAAVVVNSAGAWAGQWPPIQFPARPVKGQMLAVAAPRVLQHVIRAPEVYLVPRSDGRVLIGSTLEEAGYDKRTDATVIQRMHRAAVELVPALGESRVLEDWAGLRPGTPDGLPILGESKVPGYFVATGHFRDGILLAPITAQVMGRVIAGKKPEHEISAFSPARFAQVYTETFHI